VVALTLLGAVPAQATFPGKNGKIAMSTYVEGGSYEVFSMNPDGSEQTNLSRSPISDLEPAWSPDGTRIAFTRGFYDNYETWTMNADGTDQRDVSNNPRPDISPAFSPDGTTVVFSTDRDDVTGFYTDFDLWLMNADGTDQRSFTSNLVENVQDVQAAWSPDGKRIAYAHGVIGQRGVYLIDVETKDVHVLTSGVDDDGEPSWSPDGSKLAFASRRTGDGDIYVMSPGGSGRVRLTDSPLPDSDPAWSPDGTKIAYLHSGEVYLMNADGSQQVSLTASSRRFHYQVDWQPLPGPKRSDFKNTAKFCKAEQAFWGDQFASRYGGGSSAYGQCVSQNH
jgi:TolB protein